MKRATTYRSAVLLVLGMWISCNNIFAQISLDSTLALGEMEVYDNPDSAIDKGLSVYNSDSASVSHKINSLTLISTSYAAKRDYEKSLEYALKAKQYFADIDDMLLKLRILNKIASQYQQLKFFDEAIAQLDDALSLSENYSDQKEIADPLGFNFAVRGFIYKENLSCQTAITFFDKALKQYKIAMEKDPSLAGNLSIITYNKGNCYLALDNVDSAKANFLSAITYAEQVGAKSLQSFALKGLGQAYTAEQQYDIAIRTLIKAERLSENAGDLELKKSIYSSLANNYLSIKDNEKYGLYQNKYTAMRIELHENKLKTINQSIDILWEESAIKNRMRVTYFSRIQIALGALIVLLLFLFIRIILLRHKELNRLKSEIRAKKPASKNI